MSDHAERDYWRNAARAANQDFAECTDRLAAALRRAEAAEARLAKVEAYRDECHRRAKAADRKRRRSAQRWKAQALTLDAILATDSEPEEMTVDEAQVRWGKTGVAERTPEGSIHRASGLFDVRWKTATEGGEG